MISFAGSSIVMGLLLANQLKWTHSKLIADAVLASGLALVGSTSVAYFGPDENYFNWAGPATFASMGMLAISIMAIRNQ